MQITDANLGLVIYSDSEASGSTYALQASASSIKAVGLPSDVTLTATNVTVAINTTGAAVNETIPDSTQTVVFANGDNVKSFGGTLTLGIGGFSLSGDFSFSEIVSGNMSELLVGATGINAPSITATTGSAFSISNGTLGLVFYTDTATNPSTSLGYALSASATAAATTGTALSASATLTILRNTTTTAENTTITVGATTIPIVFTSSQVATAAGAFQSIAVSNASLNIDNGLIITANSGRPAPRPLGRPARASRASPSGCRIRATLRTSSSPSALVQPCIRLSAAR